MDETDRRLHRTCRRGGRQNRLSLPSPPHVLYIRVHMHAERNGDDGEESTTHTGQDPMGMYVCNSSITLHFSNSGERRMKTDHQSRSSAPAVCSQFTTTCRSASARIHRDLLDMYVVVARRSHIFRSRPRTVAVTLLGAVGAYYY